MSSFWIWAISYLTVFITKVKQSYKDQAAFQKQKDIFKKLMSHTKSAKPKEEIHPSRRLEANDQDQEVEVNDDDSQPKDTPPPKIQINNQAANPEVYGFKVVFLSAFLAGLMNIPIWLLYLFYFDNVSELFIFIQLNLCPYLTAPIVLTVILMIDKKRRRFCGEIIFDIFT